MKEFLGFFSAVFIVVSSIALYDYLSKPTPQLESLEVGHCYKLPDYSATVVIVEKMKFGYKWRNKKTEEITYRLYDEEKLKEVDCF